jgi:dienelactone hydrolase
MNRTVLHSEQLVYLVLAVVVLAGGASAAPLETLAGGEVGSVDFRSLTLPTNRILVVAKKGAPTVISADLQLPGDGTGRVPAVILLHGREGLTAKTHEWARELNRTGFASFVLDSFTGRAIQVSELRTSRSRINLGSLVIDAYRALDLLATHPRIDPSRIALMGFSNGGGVVLWARQIRFQKLWMERDRQFAAFLAFYPAACNMRFLNEVEVSDGPLRIFTGTADDQTVIEPCREFVERMRNAGKDVAMFEYPGAYHGFDSRDLPQHVFQPEVTSGRNCMFVERSEGSFAAFHRDTGKPANPKDPCISRGITLGYNLRAHEQSIADVKTFLHATFRTKR